MHKAQFFLQDYVITIPSLFKFIIDLNKIRVLSVIAILSNLLQLNVDVAFNFAKFYRSDSKPTSGVLCYLFLRHKKLTHQEFMMHIFRC